VAVTLGVLVLGLGLTRVPLDTLTHQRLPGGTIADWVVSAAFVVPGAVVGALVAARRPGNPIGWIMLLIFLLAGVPAGEYAVLDYRVHHGKLPLGGAAVALVADWPVWLVLIVIFLWLFPDGRLAGGRRRRACMALVAAGLLLALVVSASGVTAVAGLAVPVNAGGSLVAYPSGAWVAAQTGLLIAMLVAVLAWLVLQLPRYRRAAGTRRQQLKWLYSGAIVFVVSVVVSALASGNPGSPWQLVGAIGMTVFPVCIGVAVLRYRLYAIDRIISRVISYAIITAVPAGVFAGLVLLATQVLPVKTPVAVAAATLAAVALFNPLRKQVQRAVDRRFDRSHYNAEAVVAAFTARLREAVEIDAVQGDLLDVIHEAFQPAYVFVWVAAKGSAETLRTGH
jgi:MFS family permease